MWELCKPLAFIFSEYLQRLLYVSFGQRLFRSEQRSCYQVRRRFMQNTFNGSQLIPTETYFVNNKFWYIQLIFNTFSRDKLLTGIKAGSKKNCSVQFFLIAISWAGRLSFSWRSSWWQIWASAEIFTKKTWNSCNLMWFSALDVQFWWNWQGYVVCTFCESD